MLTAFARPLLSQQEVDHDRVLRQADYWLPEGDQRVMAEGLVKILNGEAEPRKDKQPVPDIKVTAEAMLKIYEGILFA